MSPITLLILVNCLPLYFVLIFKWDAGDLITLYWAENIIIGFYYILKMLCVKAKAPIMHLTKLFYIPFFLIHFGGFCAVHGMFVFTLAGGGESVDIFGTNVDHWVGPFIFIGLIVNVIQYFLKNASVDVLFMFKALFISHGFSFIYNYIYKGERGRVSLSDLMRAPYKRIVLLHMVLLFGAMPVIYFKSPTLFVLLLVVLKIFMDIKLHRASCKDKQKSVFA